jgi:hypothetical protein
LALLVSHENKWGYIHIPKTGGTSITQVLKKTNECITITGHDSLRILDVHDYFLFTFVRNPFTRIQSAFYHGVRHGLYKNDFSDFLLNANTNDLWLLPQSYYINAGKTENKKISFVGKYENFEKDFIQLMLLLKIKDYEIPHLNRNPLYNKHPNLNQEKYYKLLYTEEWQKDWVRERYKDDFKQFDYELEI